MPQVTRWTKATEELVEKQVSRVEEKLGRETRDMQSTHEQQVSSLLKEIQKNAEGKNTLKNRVAQLAKEVPEAEEEKNAFRSGMSQVEKEIQKLTEDKSSFTRRTEADDFRRERETTKPNRKNERTEENVKYLTGKTTDLEKRSRRGPFENDGPT